MDLMYIQELLNDTGLIGEDFLRKNPHIVIPYSFFIILFAVVGTFGNCLVIAAVILSKELCNTGNWFVLNLAIADLGVSSFVGPMTVFGLFKGELFFRINHQFCTFIASLCLVACFCSLNTIGAVSLNRYLFIVKNRLYRRIFTKVTTPLMCFGLWTVSFLMHFPILVGWGGSIYDRKSLFCVWDRLANRSYTIFFAVVPVGIPVSMTAFCYFKIFSFYRNHAKQISDSNTIRLTQSQKNAISLARTLFIIFFSFVLCWIPYTLILMIDEFDQLSPTVHIAVISIAHINSSVNSMIYGMTNPAFRKAYISILKLSYCRGTNNKIHVRASRIDMSLSNSKCGTSYNANMAETFNENKKNKSSKGISTIA